MTRLALNGAAAVVLFAFCWLYTLDTRINTFNGDILGYLHAADTLRAGQGLLDADNPFTPTINEDGRPYATWPPLYPVVLAVFGGGLEAARPINIICMWLTLTLGYILMRRYGQPVLVAAGLCVGFVIFITDGQLLFQTPLSESLFLPLWLTWLIVLPASRDNRTIVLSAVLNGLFAITRYIGVPFILAGMLYVGWQRGMRAAAAYGVIAGTPIALWCLRNYGYYHRLTGHVVPGDYQIGTLWQILSVLIQWTALAAVIGIPLSLIVVLWRRSSSRTV